MPIIRADKSKDFTVVSNAVFRDVRLSAKSRLIYCTICSLPDDWVLSLKGLQSIIGESREWVRRGVKELEIAGYISMKRINKNNGYLETEWTFCELPNSNSTHTPTKKITDPYVKNYAPIETVKEPIKSLKKEKSLEVMNQFNEFYQAYPKKVAKQTALKAYEKALKITTHDKIMEGVERYKKHIQANKTEPQFIAMPATWLNGGRWDDDFAEKQNLTINQKWASIYEAEKKKESNNVPRTQSNFIPPPIPPTLSTW